MDESLITEIIIGKCIDLHKSFGPGLLESAYLECLYFDLKEVGLKVRKEVALPLIYKEIKLEKGYRIDLLVEEQVVVELKCVEAFSPVHEAQILTYMKLGGFSTGLMINFQVKMLKEGIKRYKI
jgi:GxxExxY protein